MKENENRVDELNWNDKLIRTFREYENVTGKARRMAGYNILELLQEQRRYNYNFDFVKFEVSGFEGSESHKMLLELEDLLDKKTSNKYLGTHEEWNSRILNAIDEGDILETVKLISGVQGRGFYVTGPDENVVYCEEIRLLMRNIAREHKTEGR